MGDQAVTIVWLLDLAVAITAVLWAAAWIRYEHRLLSVLRAARRFRR